MLIFIESSPIDEECGTLFRKSTSLTTPPRASRPRCRPGPPATFARATFYSSGTARILAYLLKALYNFGNGFTLKNKAKFLGLPFRLARTMESLHIKLSGRYVRGTGPKLSKKRKGGYVPPGPEVLPITHETATYRIPTSPPPTEYTVPEVVFEDETMYGLLA